MAQSLIVQSCLDHPVISPFLHYAVVPEPALGQ